MTDESIPVAPDPGQPEVVADPTSVASVRIEEVSREVSVERTGPMEDKDTVSAPEPRKPLTQNPVFLISMIAILVAVVGLCFVGWLLASNNTATPTISTPTATPTVTATDDAEPPPFSAEGAQSWTEWMAKANALKDDGKLGMWQALADLHFGGSLKKAFAAVKYQATKESIKSLDYYVRVVPAGGLPVLNTSPTGKSYVPIPNRVLKPGDTYLVLDKDSPFVKGGGGKADDPTDSGKETPAVRRACANPIKISRGKGPDTTNGAARQKIRDKNAVTDPTPGYPGNGEEIVKEQERTAGATDNNGQVGHAGPAVPGTNSSGEMNYGGGAADTSLPGGVETPATGDTGPPD